MTLFQRRVLGFHRDFEAERCVIVPISSVNGLNANELKEEGLKLVKTCSTQCRYHYMSNAHDVAEKELFFAMHKFRVLNVSQTMALWPKPGQKDRYTMAIEYLTAREGEFAQIIYLFLVSDDVSDDDKRWFCFVTFPALFNFLLTDVDQGRAMNVIERLLILHKYLHGANFSKKHTFLMDITFSCFAAMNPGRFFESCVVPIVSGLYTDAKRLQARYNISSLLRVDYWRHLTRVAVNLLVKMKESIALLPTPCRSLIQRIASVYADDMSNTRSLVMNHLFFSYIQTLIGWEHNEIRDDLLTALRALINQDSVNETAKMLDPQWCDKGKAALEDLITVLLSDDNQEQNGVSDGVMLVGRCTVVTPRDLSLLGRAIKRFMSCCDKGYPQGMHTFELLELPKKAYKNRYLLLRTDDANPLKVKTEDVLDMDLIVNAMNFLNVDNLQFANATELKRIIDKCVGQFLTSNELIRIRKLPLSLEDCDVSYKAVKENHRLLQDLAGRLSAGAYYVTDERMRRLKQISHLNQFHIEQRVCPLLIRKYPDELEFVFSEMFANKDELRKAYVSLLGKLSSILAKYESDSIEPLKKYFIWRFIDQLDICVNLQESKRVPNEHMLFDRDPDELKSVADALNQRKINQVTNVVGKLMKVHPKHRISQNVKWIIQGMTYTESFTTSVSSYALVLTRNGWLFAMAEIIELCILDLPSIIEVLFNKREIALLEKFVLIINEFRNSAKPELSE